MKNGLSSLYITVCLINTGGEQQNCVWLHGDHIDFSAAELLTGNAGRSTVAQSFVKYTVYTGKKKIPCKPMKI